MTVSAPIVHKTTDAGAAAARAFRACLGQYATGVTVMTTHGDGTPVGVTANSFSSLSLDPPLIMWAIARSSRSFAAFAGAKRFAVNILAADQIELSQTFSSRQTEKFARVAWHASEIAPILDNVAAVLECETHATHDGGDHLLIVGCVRKFQSNDKSGLVFAQGRYGVTAEHPTVRESVRMRTVSGGQVSPLMALLMNAYQHMTTLFEEHRRKAGLNITQAKILYVLNGGSHGAGQMAKTLFLGQRECDDAIADLVAQGHIVSNEVGIYCMTERGRARWDALQRTAEKFEAVELRGIPVDEVEMARSFLEKLVRKHLPEE